MVPMRVGESLVEVMTVRCTRIASKHAVAVDLVSQPG